MLSAPTTVNLLCPPVCVIRDLHREYIKNSHISIIKRQINQSKNVQRILQTFPQRYTNAQKHMKRCSTSLVVTGTQIKTIARHHFIPARMATSKKTDSVRAAQAGQQLEPLCTACGAAGWAATWKAWKHRLTMCSGEINT